MAPGGGRYLDDRSRARAPGAGRRDRRMGRRVPASDPGFRSRRRHGRRGDLGRAARTAGDLRAADHVSAGDGGRGRARRAGCPNSGRGNRNRSVAARAWCNDRACRPPAARGDGADRCRVRDLPRLRAWHRASCRSESRILCVRFGRRDRPAARDRHPHRHGPCMGLGSDRAARRRSRVSSHGCLLSDSRMDLLKRLSRGADRRALAAIAALLAAPELHAHGVVEGSSAFLAGLVHPVTALEHVLPLLALGMLAGQRGLRAGEGLIVAFPLAFACGAFGATLFAGLPDLSVVNAATALVIGALVALAFGLPRLVLYAVVIFTGALHGLANGAAVVGALPSFIAGATLSATLLFVYAF